jgi:hypothetical protein
MRPTICNTPSLKYYSKSSKLSKISVSGGGGGGSYNTKTSKVVSGYYGHYYNTKGGRNRGYHYYCPTIPTTLVNSKSSKTSKAVGVMKGVSLIQPMLPPATKFATTSNKMTTTMKYSYYRSRDHHTRSTTISTRINKQ